MNIYAIETFIDFCSGMEIAQETSAPISNKVDKGFIAKRQSILNTAFKVAKSLSKKYHNVPGIILNTDKKTLLSHSQYDYSLYQKFITDPNSDYMIIGDWDIHPYWQKLVNDGYEIFTNDDMWNSQQIEEFNDILVQIELEFEKALKPFNVMLEDDRDWDSGVFIIRIKKP